MLESYKIIEKEVEELESIENWSDRVNKMKELKERITMEKTNLNELINSILKGDIKPDSKKKKLDLESLVTKFKQTDNLDDKIKYYQLISSRVSEIEKQLFD